MLTGSTHLGYAVLTSGATLSWLATHHPGGSHPVPSVRFAGGSPPFGISDTGTPSPCGRLRTRSRKDALHYATPPRGQKRCPQGPVLRRWLHPIGRKSREEQGRRSKAIVISTSLHPCNTWGTFVGKRDQRVSASTLHNLRRARVRLLKICVCIVYA